MAKAVRVVLDTNFALIPAQFGVDIFEGLRQALDIEYKLCILDKSLDELMKVEKTAKGADKRAAVLTVALLEKKGVKVLKSSSEAYVDDLLVELGKEGAIIATQDKGLKERLKELQVPIIILRQKKFIELRR